MQIIKCIRHSVCQGIGLVIVFSTLFANLLFHHSLKAQDFEPDLEMEELDDSESDEKFETTDGEEEGQSTQQGAENLEAEQQEESGFSEEDQENEISLSQTELRESKSTSYSLTIGQTTTWQHFSFVQEFVQSPKDSWAYFLAKGRDRIPDSEGRSYRMNVDTISIGGLYQYFISHSLPFYIEGGFGLTQFQGTIEQTGQLAGESLDSSDYLRSGLDGLGFQLHTGLGISFIKEDGFFLKYQILGLGFSQLLGLTLQNSSSTLEDGAKSNLTGSRAWGFVNLTVGYLY